MQLALLTIFHRVNGNPPRAYIHQVTAQSFLHFGEDPAGLEEREQHLFLTDYRLWCFATIRAFDADLIPAILKFVPFWLVYYIAMSVTGNPYIGGIIMGIIACILTVTNTLTG